MSSPHSHHGTTDRPTGQAMLRGALGRCPACAEALHHQRADDGPAYLTILLVSHLGAPLLLASFVAWRPSAMTMIWTFGLGAVVLSLLLLPRIKGAMVGLQWARRMHGFDTPQPARDT